MTPPGGQTRWWIVTFQLLQNMPSDHKKVKEGTELVFYMTIPSHTTERVEIDNYSEPNVIAFGIDRSSPVLKAPLGWIKWTR